MTLGDKNKPVGDKEKNPVGVDGASSIRMKKKSEYVARMDDENGTSVNY
jgi:hypothetical protein